MKYRFLITFVFITISTFSQSVEEVFGTWNIRNGNVVENNSENTDIAIEYWEAFNKIFPKQITKKYIKKLVLMTDGLDEKTGALVSLSKDNSKWQLVLDIQDVNFTVGDRKRLYESVYTLVHEFGHLITLNNSQIKPSQKRESKEGEPYITFEGQAYRNSYLNKFVTLFWKKELLATWDYIQREYCYTEASCVDKLFDFAQENFTEFITDYAAESPEEDIVESWTAFVLRPKIKNPKTTAQKKINFFYKYPELVEMRAQIKRNTRKFLH